MEILEPAFVAHIPRVLDYAQYRLPSTDGLDGSAAALELDGGGRLELNFAAGEVGWRLEEQGEAAEGRDTYDAVEVRPDLFYVDFVTSLRRTRDRAMCIVLDLSRSRAIVLINDLVEDDGRLRLVCKASTARVQGTENYEPVELTSELTGRRLFCEYGDDVVIEHTYLDSRALAWQWLRCPVPELTHEVSIETNRFWKLDEDLYLLLGQEPSGFGTESLTLVMDLDQKRNVGRLFGSDTAGDPVDYLVGAKLTLLSHTKYPDGYQPA